MKKKVLFHRKDFINSEGHLSDASICSSISRSSYSDEKWFWETELKIRDCSNMVYLELELNGDDERKNTIYKLGVLIDHLNDLQEAILNIKDEAISNSDDTGNVG